MSLYEHIVMISPEIGQNQIRVVLDKYKKLIEKFSGVLCSYEFWGLRKLAYSINRHEKAFYFLLNLECDNKLVTELSFFGNNNNAILRYLTIKVKEFDLGSELKSEDICNLTSDLINVNDPNSAREVIANG